MLISRSGNAYKEQLMPTLKGKKVAILVADGFEQVEYRASQGARRGGRRDQHRLACEGAGSGLESLRQG
jgi:hypothetical protein